MRVASGRSGRMRMKLVGVCIVAAWVACLYGCAVAIALPEGRALEMVSPSYKGGYGVGGVSAVAPSGESVAFTSLGQFANPLWDSSGTNAYIARRGSSGWTTESVQPPPVGNVLDFSPGLEYVLGVVSVVPKVDVFGPEEFMLHDTSLPDTTSNWEAPGDFILNKFDEEAGFAAIGASRNLCQILGFSNIPLLPEAMNAVQQLYDFSSGCEGEEPSLRLVGVNNGGKVFNPKCTAALGIEREYETETERGASFNAISADGSQVFFTASVEKGINCANGDQLFVRLGGERTLEISRPLEASKPFGGCGAEGEVPCAGASTRASAYFKGASEDGSRVFFMTKASLTGEDKDTQNDLYMATIGCPESERECETAQRQVTSLVQVSHDPTAGEAADVQGVVRVAPDGERVYFVARGVLGEGVNAEGEAPVAGADNFYMYDTGSGGTTFITGLCSGPALSGGVEDLRCPPNLEEGANVGRNDLDLWGFASEAQSTFDGQFLVFSSFGQLTKGATGTARNIYRYDAATGLLDRVSHGEAGYDANGNDNVAGATINPVGINPDAFADHEMKGRAISEDGSRIVFESAGPLSPQATNGLPNVYEWSKQEGASEGQVSLVSCGCSLTFDGYATISPSGRDIFFTTTAQLLPQDTDEVRDLYDARVGGGFPALAAPRQPCSGDACQGPLTNPAPLLIPGSVEQAPEAKSVPKAKTKTKTKTKKTKKSKKTRKSVKSDKKAGTHR